MKIGGLQKLTLIDYPDKVAATVFLAGCNLSCPWCHSSELVEPEKIERLSGIEKEELFDFLEERKGVLDGVVICGGEPTIHSELEDLISEIKDLGYEVKLDTNGTNPEVLNELLEEDLLDYVAMDLKGPFDRYEEFTGQDVDSENLKRSVELVKALETYEFRTTIVPGLHDLEAVEKMADVVAPARAYYLQTFRPKKLVDEEVADTRTSKEKLKKMKKAVEDKFQICKIR